MALLELYLAIGVTLVLATAGCVFLFLDKKRSFWKDRNFPCTGRAKMIYGDYKNMNQTEHMQYINQRIYNEFKARKLPIGGTVLFLVPSTVVVDPDLIKAMLVKDFNFFHDRGVYNNPEVDPLTGHLFSLEGQAWRQLRAKLSPTFTSGKMKMMFSTILNVADDLKEFLWEKTESGSTELEMKNVLAGFTTDVIGSCAFGIECNSLRATHCRFREVSRKIFEQSVGQMLWMIVLMLFKGVATKLKLKATPAEVENFFTNMVQETIDHRERNNVQRSDFMNILIQMKNSTNLEEKLTLNEITAQSRIRDFLDHHGQLPVELAMIRDIQEKLRAEIFKVCGEGDLTYESVSSVEYLNMVIDETLRKHPVVDSLLRTSTQPYNIPNTDLKIPKGTFVFIPVHALHHDPDYYPDPDRFDPERFNAENRASRHPFVYLPFGEGPRNCIGMRFGLMQTRVGLITVLRNFRVRPSSNTPERLVVNPKSGIPAPLGGIPLLIERI
ncbi:AAEL014892-PA [Aedes aegypti]|uniref:AAEL014892-PA n=1 Tax=Aedes aegypti TaxID=7159 RepID=Q16F57_AEDAE|nr:AAEL014892-PA [Aedes aegypti]